MSSPVMATPVFPMACAVAPIDVKAGTVLDDDPAIVRVKKKLVEPEREKLNTFAGKKLKSSPSKKEGNKKGRGTVRYSVCQ